MRSRWPLPLRLYRMAWGLGGPALGLLIRRRVRQGREDPARTGERFGHASGPRPRGTLIWLHGASVGEGLSMLPLISRLHAARPDARVLVTTGTVTSARIMTARLPAHGLHQYAPLDHPAAAARFLGHWRPDLAVWLESELWPNLLRATARRGIPMALVNARISAAALRNWSRLPASIARLLECFSLCLAQSATDAQRLRSLGAQRVEMPGNLKYDARRLAVDAAADTALRRAVGGRSIWLAASTHDGEERIAMDAHRRLTAARPGLLTIIAPRHPARGPDIAAAISGAGQTAVRRATGALPGPDTDIYLADTMGELGLFYSLAQVVFMGGTLAPHGGHNPLEPALLRRGVLHGPHAANFTDAFELLADADAAHGVADAATLAAAVAARLDDPALTEREGRWAQAAAQSARGAARRIAAHLLSLLPPTPAPAVSAASAASAAWRNIGD